MAVFIVFETLIGGEEKIIKIELLEELNFTNMTPGKKFRDAIKNNSPLIIPGAINAYSAKLAERANHKAIYLSGSGADEIFSDYGFDGIKHFRHSTIGGLFPEDLDTVFPWKNFFFFSIYF